MQPNQYYSAPQRRQGVIGRRLALLLVLLVLLGVGFFTYRQLVFRVSKTEPNMNHVATATAFIKIYFNRPISSKGLDLSYSSTFISKYAVHDNEIDLTTIDGSLTKGKKYTITINYVASTGGKVIKGKKLTFSPINLPLNNLSKDERAAIVGRQEQYPYNAQYINYVGFDPLLDAGLSTDQMTTLKQDLYGYSNQVNQKFWTITLVPHSLSVQIHNAESENLDDNYTFDVTLGNTTYHAHALADPIDDQLQLQLLDGNNNVVYDSVNGTD
jgi:hypothetical protein